MDLTVYFLAIVAIAWLFLFLGAPLILWSIGLLVALLIYPYSSGAILSFSSFTKFFDSINSLFTFDSISKFYSSSAVCPYVLTAVFLTLVVFNIPYLRRNLVTRFIFIIFKKVLPPMSDTEKQAIESGDVWWDKELFSGRPNWDNLLKFKSNSFTEEEQKFIDEKVPALCKMIDDWDITQNSYDLNSEAWNYLKNEGFFSLLIPKEYGGLEFSAYANSSIVQMIATRSISAAVTTMVPNSLGPGELLMEYGTDEQKDYYLPRLAKGVDIPCFALTGVEAGSDAGSIPDKGIVCKGQFNGEEVLGMKLTWEKRYITLAPVATVLGLAIKLFDPDKLIGDIEEIGITVCLLPVSTPGVEIGNRHFPLNQPFMNGPTRGNEVFVPLDYIIGGIEMAGKGWKMLTECLAAGRGISLPALSAAATKVAYRSVGSYAKIRRQFGTSIGNFGGVQEAMAQIAGRNYMVEAARLLTVAAVDNKLKPAVITAIAKYHMTENARKAIEHAMDVQAGKAIMLGPKNCLGRIFQSMPISITVEGANILTRNLIIFGQGAIRCHPFIMDEMSASDVRDKKLSLKVFDRAIFKHISYLITNITKLGTNVLFFGAFTKLPLKSKAPLKYFRHLNVMSLALYVASDVSLIYLGGKLKRLERISARLGDVLSYLYLASATLKFYQDAKQSDLDDMHLKWVMEYCLYNIQEAFFDLFRNYPNKLIALLLKSKMFPIGRRYKKPSDNLEAKMANAMMSQSDFRDKVTMHVYEGEDSPLATFEKAFALLPKALPILAKIDKAVRAKKITKHASIVEKINLGLRANIITSLEAETYLEYNKARLDVVNVDEFSDENLFRK